MASGKYNQITCTEDKNGSQSVKFRKNEEDRTSFFDVTENPDGNTTVVSGGNIKRSPDGHYINLETKKSEMAMGSEPMNSDEYIANDLKKVCNAMGSKFKSIKPLSP